MAVENIKRELDALGYLTYFSWTFLEVARKVSDEDPRVINIRDFFCRVAEDQAQFKVIYHFGNIPDEKMFESETQVIIFIKQQFPL